MSLELNTQGVSTTGRMTSVMRAALPSGPKLLRIARMSGGRIVEERWIPWLEPVTVGRSERNTFVVDAPGLPSSWRAFDAHDGRYVLNLVDGTRAKLAEGDRITELTGHAAPRVPLGEQSRGKLVLGDVTLLFQFAVAPPIAPRAQLPLSVLRRGRDVDWTTTVIAAFCFFVHFLAIGAIYSDWLDPIQDDEVRVAGLWGSTQSLPVAPPIETAAGDAPARAAESPSARKDATSRAPTSGAPAASRSAGAALQAELEAVELSTLGALNQSQSATANVLADGEVPTGLLDAAAASAVAVSGPRGLTVARRGSVFRPGDTRRDLRDLGERRRGPTQTGDRVAIAAPKGSTAVGRPTSTGTVSDAARVVASLRPGFRRCYNRALIDYPDAQGTLRLSLQVGPGGEVSHVGATASGNIPPSLLGCVRDRARAATFALPEGGSALVLVPVSLIRL